MASSLSNVPPVWPSARPLIMGTASPQAAAMGATRKLVLSPTPPVECLSTATLPRRWGENFSPESRMAMVRERVSSSDKPRSHEPRGELLGRDGSGGGAGDEETNFAVVEHAAIALFANDVGDVERSNRYNGIIFHEIGSLHFSFMSNARGSR